MPNLSPRVNLVLRSIVAALLGLGSSFAASAADTMDNAYWNMPKGVTEISHRVWWLHMYAFWICVVIGVLVFGVMFYSLFAHRRSKHPVAATFHESTTVEIAWTIAPFLILIAMAVPAASTLIKMYDTRDSDLTIKITGYQWKWQYEYVDQGVSFFATLEPKANAARQLHSGIDPRTVPNYLHDADNYLVLPVGKKVRFLLTSDDVIHGWWVPEEGRHPGLHQRDVGQDRRARHLPRPVHRALRPRPRLHADRGQGRVRAGIRAVAGAAEGGQRCRRSGRRRGCPCCN
jgi:cytochrome c oxidase subunit 2